MVFALRALLLTAALIVSSVVEAAPVNIVAIGASNTAGWGVGLENAYPAQLQALLRKRGIKANVTNAGIPGDVTAGMLRRLDSAVPAGTNVVILQPGSFVNVEREPVDRVAFFQAGQHAGHQLDW